MRGSFPVRAPTLVTLVSTYICGLTGTTSCTGATAATAYADAATQWRRFGDLPELAYALLGQGRCLVALGMPEADSPLGEARDLFTAMGYAPAVSETDALLHRATATTS